MMLVPQHSLEEQAGYLIMFLLMAATPYVLLVVVGGGLFRAMKRQREAEVEQALAEQVEWERTRTLEGDQ